MTTTHTEIVQATCNLHHEIRNTIVCQPLDIFDNPTTFDACEDMLDHYAHAGDNAVDELVSGTQCLAARFFWVAWSTRLLAHTLESRYLCPGRHWSGTRLRPHRPSFYRACGPRQSD